jgi:predicted dehydrogenase
LLNIGIIGLGFMGRVHLDAWSRLPDARVAAVADPKPHRRAGDFSAVQGNLGADTGHRDLSGVRGYETAEELLGDSTLQAVDICLPTDRHLPVALAALRAGKHVLVEKPMALSGTECDCLIDAARGAGRVLMAAQAIRFWPDYAVARELYYLGRIGRLHSAVFRRRCAAPAWGAWLQDPVRSGGGVFDLLIHDVDYCQQVFGLPAAVTAVGVEAVERGLDWVEARLDYPLGALVVISGGWHHPGAYPFSMDFTLLGDDGTLEFHSTHRRLTLYPVRGPAEQPDLPAEDAYEAEIRYFCECARAGRWPERCPPEDSAAAVHTLRAIQESRRRGGEKITL